MTNREWINTLSNEQLVKVMRTFKQSECSCCAYFYSSCADECAPCLDGQVAWMDEEHDDNDWAERDFWYCVW